MRKKATEADSAENDNENEKHGPSNTDGNDIVMSSKSRFKGDAANKPKMDKQAKLVMEVYINRFPLTLYNRIVAFQKKHENIDGFAAFCLKLIENQLYTEESCDKTLEARQPEAKP